METFKMERIKTKNENKKKEMENSVHRLHMHLNALYVRANRAYEWKIHRLNIYKYSLFMHTARTQAPLLCAIYKRRHLITSTIHEDVVVDVECITINGT